MIYFLSADEKELLSGILSADKSADHRPTVGAVNEIAVFVLHAIKINEHTVKNSVNRRTL